VLECWRLFWITPWPLTLTLGDVKGVLSVYLKTQLDDWWKLLRAALFVGFAFELVRSKLRFTLAVLASLNLVLYIRPRLLVLNRTTFDVNGQNTNDILHRLIVWKMINFRNLRLSSKRIRLNLRKRSIIRDDIRVDSLLTLKMLRSQENLVFLPAFTPTIPRSFRIAVISLFFNYL